MVKLTLEEKHARQKISCRKHRAKEKEFGVKFAQLFRAIVDAVMIIWKKEGRHEEWEKLLNVERRKEPKFEEKLMILIMVREVLSKWKSVVPLSEAVPKGPVFQLPS